MSDLQKLADDRLELENELYAVLARYMGKWWNKKTEVPHLAAERLSFAIAGAFVDWALVQKGVLRDKQNNLLEQEDNGEKHEGGGG